MHVLLVAINAKYIHSCPAIYSLQQAAAPHVSATIDTAEFTVNQHREDILREIFVRRPDCIGFSCYLWNYETVRHLVTELKVVLPHTRFLLGGPEVSYTPDQTLREIPADVVMVGEGEQTIVDLLRCLCDKGDLSKVAGIVYRKGEELVTTAPTILPEMDALPFIYPDHMDSFTHKILYYESSRGCPYQCQYCLSGQEHSVRFRSLPQVLSHLQFFLDQKVKQVKFIDRNFHIDQKRSIAIWEYLIDHDNGITNFHFEIVAELLDDTLLALLRRARPGQFQMEIGVQSTYEPTLKAVRRITDYPKLQEVLPKLHAPRNIHLHLDLIVGLPHEDYDTFAQSFNDVFALRPDQFQVGFLKLLKGSGLWRDAKKYELVGSPYAPYEVRRTNSLTFSELLRLKMLAEMVEIYYNSGRFVQTLDVLSSLFDTPFACFEALGDFFAAHEFHLQSHTAMGYYTILHHFFATLKRGDENAFCRAVLFDLYAHEKVKQLPEWLLPYSHPEIKNAIYDFYRDPTNIENYLPEYNDCDPKQLYRQVHIQYFADHPQCPDGKPVTMLFNYRRRDLLGHAHTTVISLEGGHAD